MIDLEFDVLPLQFDWQVARPAAGHQLPTEDLCRRSLPFANEVLAEPRRSSPQPLQERSGHHQLHLPHDVVDFPTKPYQSSGLASYDRNHPLWSTISSLCR